MVKKKDGKKKRKSDNIFKLLENILQMEIGIIEIKFVCCYSDNNRKHIDSSSVVFYVVEMHWNKIACTFSREIRVKSDKELMLENRFSHNVL